MAGAQSHDPSLSHPTTNALNTAQSGPQTGVQNPINPADLAGVQLPGLDRNQIMSLLQHLPGVFELAKQGNLKEDAAQTLSNLAQTPFGGQGPHHPLVQHPYPGPQHPGGLPGINDPGPSSHPRGPPNLGQLSAVALQAATSALGQRPPQPGPMRGAPGQEVEEGPSDADDAAVAAALSSSAKDGASPTPPASTGRTRGSRSATMGSDEWSRQRKDNHKEVERRRRGNINEGINELGRIVPNGSGEKAKGAILSRAVQYIHHLKDNEARNIEKWTLEKLLMDQAMGDLQSQVDEAKRLWEEERMARQRAENELELLRNMHGIVGNNAVQPVVSKIAGNSSPTQTNPGGGDANSTDAAGANKRRNEGESEAAGEGDGAERDGKRQRTE